MTDQPAVQVAGLRKSYGNVSVLTGVDLTVPRGEVFALLGPNGAGKTTTVRILTTLIPADAGTARVDGFDVFRDRSAVRRRISLTGQYASIDELQTGAENLKMMARLAGLRGSRARARADGLLERFALSDAAGRLVRTYSGGMRRRLDLAAGLLGGPSVIFLDEPTTGLDLRSRQAMWEVIADLAAEGTTVFLTTQYLEEADRLAARIALVDGGRVVADDSPDALKHRFAEQRLDLTLVDAGAYQAMAARLGAAALAPDPARRTVGVATDGSAGHVRALLDELDPERTLVHAFALHAATLDDVFLALTGQAAASGAPEPEALHV